MIVSRDQVKRSCSCCSIDFIILDDFIMHPQIGTRLYTSSMFRLFDCIGRRMSLSTQMIRVRIPKKSTVFL